MKEKFELGPKQKQWIKDLKKYPERQTAYYLGSKENGKIQACCLGQGLITLLGEEAFLGGSYIEDGEGETSCLENSFKLLGLRSAIGTFKEKVYLEEFTFPRGGGGFSSLLAMNDNGVPWKVIADYMEEQPENVFKESK